MSTTAPSRQRLDEIAVARLQADLKAVRPDLADRLAEIVAGATTPASGSYVRLGEASRELGVSRNTLKKWIRGGLVRDAMQLPGSKELRVARTEIDRLRDYSIHRVALEALGDDEESVESTKTGIPPWRR
jgi:hypothetical protein